MTRGNEYLISFVTCQEIFFYYYFSLIFYFYFFFNFFPLEINYPFGRTRSGGFYSQYRMKTIRRSKQQEKVQEREKGADEIN